MPEEQQTLPPQAAAAFQSALEKKNGDGVALASQLFDENFGYRETIRELKKQQPKEGELVLSADDAKEYNKFKSFLSESKLDLKAVKEAVEKVPALEKENKDLAGMETLRELAEVGLDGSKLKVNVLKDQISKYPEAVIRFDTQKDKDGNESKVAFIKTKPDAAEVSFTDFAAENLSDYLPALKVSAEQPPVRPGNTQDPKPQGGATSVFDRIRESAKQTAKVQKPDIDAVFGRPAAAA